MVYLTDYLTNYNPYKLSYILFLLQTNIKPFYMNLAQIFTKKEYCLLNKYFLVKLLPLKLSSTLMKVFLTYLAS